MLTLIPPWAQALIVVTVLAGTGAYGYHKGYQSRDIQAQLEAAAEAKADQALADHQAQLTQQRELAYEAEKQRLQSLPPKIIHDRVITYLSSLCTSAGGVPPSIGKSTGSTLDAAATDAAIRRTDLITNIVAAQANKAQLIGCTGFLVDHGFAP